MSYLTTRTSHSRYAFPTRMPRSPEQPEAGVEGSVRTPDGRRTPALFVDLARISESVASTRSRLRKKAFFVDALARVPGEEIAAAVGWLVAEPLCGPLGVGPAQLWALSRTEAPLEATVSLSEVESTLEVVRRGPREGVATRVSALFGRLTQPERALFVGALTGSLRQGSLGGIMLVAIAHLSGLDEATVRRTAMVTGSVPRAAAALLGPGRGAPPPSTLELFRPVAPMLASPAASLEDAFSVTGGGESVRLVEWKVDGVRAQIHKMSDRVAVFSRQGNDLSAGCEPLLAALATMDVESTVVDGEVVLVSASGVARPFQDTFSAIASRTHRPPGRSAVRLPVRLPAS